MLVWSGISVNATSKKALNTPNTTGGLVLGSAANGWIAWKIKADAL